MQGLAGDGLSANALTNQATNVRSGARSWKADSGAGAQDALTRTQTMVLGTSYFLRAYFKFDTIPTADAFLIRVSAGLPYDVRLKTDGKLYLAFNGSTNIGSPSDVLVTDTWYRIELQWNIGTGAADSAELMLDGVSIASETGANRTDTVPTTFTVGFPVSSPGANIVCYVDDIALNDDTGSDQNSWPGEGHVVNLLPTTDAGGAGVWTLGTGTAYGGNAHTAVANTPPLGVVDRDAGSDVKQVRDNVSSLGATAFDLTDYTTGGVPAGSTINLVELFAWTAAAVATGARTGSLALTNPTVAAVDFGTFWSGTGDGTFPTGWIRRSLISYAPTAPTLGTAPRITIAPTVASTRICMVCSTGVVVEYTEPAAPVTITQSADALVLKAATVAQSADANIGTPTTLTVSQSADADIVRSVQQSADAYVPPPTPGPQEVAADDPSWYTALIDSLGGGSFGYADPHYYLPVAAAAVSTVTQSADALVLKAATVAQSADALVLKAATVAQSADAYVAARLTVTQSADALILKTVTVAQSADALVLRTITLTQSVDALVLVTLTRVQLADAYIVSREMISQSADALVRLSAAQVGQGSDAFVVRRSVLTQSADALTFKRAPGLHGAAGSEPDEDESATGSESSEGSALGTETTTGSATDTLLPEGEDSVLQLYRLATSHHVDALVRVTLTRTQSVDALVLKVDTRTHSTDALIE